MNPDSLSMAKKLHFSNQNELRGAPSHLERFEYLMANWETLNREDGKRYGWTTNQMIADTLGLLVEVIIIGNHHSGFVHHCDELYEDVDGVLGSDNYK